MEKWGQSRSWMRKKHIVGKNFNGKEIGIYYNFNCEYSVFLTPLVKICGPFSITWFDIFVKSHVIIAMGFSEMRYCYKFSIANFM